MENKKEENTISTQNSTLSSIPSSLPTSNTKSISDSIQNSKPSSSIANLDPIIPSSIFESKLWGQYESLHKRHLKKLDCYENCFKKFELFYNNLEEIMKSLNNINFSMEAPTSSFILNLPRLSIGSHDEELKKLYRDTPNTISIIKSVLEDQLEESNRTIKNILLIFSSFIKQMKEEKKEYDDFQKYLNNYNNLYSENKKLIEKNMKLYHQKGQLAEKAVLDYKKVEVISNTVSDTLLLGKVEDKAKESLSEYIKPYNLYKEGVNKSNEMRKEFIKRQNKLLNLYFNLEKKTEVLNADIIQIFYQSSKNQLNTKKESIDDFEDMINNINKGKNIKELIQQYGKNEKPDDEIKLIHFPSGINFDLCDNTKTFNTFLETILYIKDYNIDEYPNFNEKDEREKNDMRELINKLFEKYSENDESKLMAFINNPSRHNAFFTILNKHSNKCLNNNIKLFDMLGNIFNIILDSCFIDNNFENAKNCIIFSKAFFYNSEDNTRHYLIEKIKDHKWLTTSIFWRSFILININQELMKFLSFYNNITIYDIEEMNEKITDKIKNKLSDLFFSQILPYMSNMSEFNISTDIIAKVIEEFCSKYRYLDEQKIEDVLSIVIKDKLEIRNIKYKIKKYLLTENNNKDETQERIINRYQRKRKSNVHIKYDHLKKEEKVIEDPL